MRDKLEQLLSAALGVIADQDGPAELAGLDPGLERARDTEHGDFASNVAMRAAKLARRSPRDLAEAIVAALTDDPFVAATEVAGPGFINFRLSADAWIGTVQSILEQGEAYGQASPGSRGSVLVEYLSANPTGPLHVGHGRHAAYGASLAAILRAGGYHVDEEYYVNDAGRQMDIVATSVWLRYAERHGHKLDFPSNCYQGDYIGEIADKLVTEHGGALLGEADPILAVIEAFGDDREKNLDDLIAALPEWLQTIGKMAPNGFVVDRLTTELMSVAAWSYGLDSWLILLGMLGTGFVLCSWRLGAGFARR